MKKLLIITILLIFITGCNKCEECEKVACNEEKEITKEDLNTLLDEYGYYVFQNGNFITNESEVKTYTITLKEMYERNNYDITAFIKKKCKLDTTKIDFIVKSLNPLTYEYKNNLDCEI